MSQLDELKESDWYKSRPAIIQQAIDTLNPLQLLVVKETGQQCQIYSYDEPESGLLEDLTVTVSLTGVGRDFNRGILGQYNVFGYKLTDLEPWETND